MRNSERLIEAAKAVFEEAGVDVSLDEIARRAGVGIGTLYRHFPSRDAMIAAVYRHEVEKLAEAAPGLLETLSPSAALHRWMHLFVDYIASKKLIAPAVSMIVGGVSTLYPASGARITAAVALLVECAKNAGEIRADADPADVLRALVGFTYGNSAPDWIASASRLIDILMDGLRVRPPG